MIVAIIEYDVEYAALEGNLDLPDITGDFLRQTQKGQIIQG